VLKRILASLAVTSLILTLVLCVYWWRSKHGHTDSFTLGNIGSTQTHFTFANGRIGLEVSDHVGTTVMGRVEFYEFKNVLGACLLIPGLWLAIKIRSLLPKPPGRK
jgi:hypothetical protein